MQIRVAGGWATGCDVRFYAQMPTADALAQRAGFRSRDFYMVIHLILDPTILAEFQDMSMALFGNLEDTLAAMVEVRHERPAHACWPSRSTIGFHAGLVADEAKSAAWGFQPCRCSMQGPLARLLLLAGQACMLQKAHSITRSSRALLSIVCCSPTYQTLAISHSSCGIPHPPAFRSSWMMIGAGIWW